MVSLVVTSLSLVVFLLVFSVPEDISPFGQSASGGRLVLLFRRRELALWNAIAILRTEQTDIDVRVNQLRRIDISRALLRRRMILEYKHGLHYDCGLKIIPPK